MNSRRWVTAGVGLALGYVVVSCAFAGLWWPLGALVALWVAAFAWTNTSTRAVWRRNTGD